MTERFSDEQIAQHNEAMGHFLAKLGDAKQTASHLAGVNESLAKYDDSDESPELLAVIETRDLSMARKQQLDSEAQELGLEVAAMQAGQFSEPEQEPIAQPQVPSPGDHFNDYGNMVDALTFD